jgi:hypothetical protein
MSLLSLRRVAGTLLFAAAISISSSPAYAADINARIKGTVTDPSKAEVPGATVTATNLATGVKFTTTSQKDGGYLFAQLPIGTYSITATAPGFKTFKASGIALTIDQEYVEPITFAAGSTSDVIDVAADSIQVNTTDMQINGIVTAAQMTELPNISRSFTNFELVQPGVQASSDRFGGFSSDGGQTQQSSFLINGADTNDLALNTVTFSPNLDAIEEFNLVSGPLNAEYDRNSAGIVNAALKSGTNQFHGDAFEFYRDTFLNTGNFFSYSTATHKKVVTAYHQNIYGGTIGGPVIKNKLFGFFAYQGTHQRVPGSGGSTTVFDAAQRGGDFTEDINGTNPLAYTLSSTNTNIIPAGLTQLTGACAPGNTWGNCIAFNGGKFNPSLFNPVAAKLLTTFNVPTPNSSANQYVFQSVSATKINQYLARGDYSPTTKDRITGVFIHQSSNATATIPFTGASLPGFGELDTTSIYQFTADYVRTISSSLVNDLAAHYTRFNYGAVEPQNIVAPSTLGFSITPENVAAQSVPLISTGYFSLGFSNNGPQPRVDQTYQLDDSISKSLGHHQLKFGYDGRKFQVSNPFSANNNGNFGFSSGGTYSSGDPGLDFLLGNSNSYSQGSGAVIQAYAFLNYFYGQDTWKVSDNFTLSYGLGYSIDTPLHNIQYGGEAIICFIPGQKSTVFNSAPAGINYPGDPGCTNSAQSKTHYNEFGPRIGFAFTPDLGWLSDGNSHKFSIRGGFGLYYNRTEEETSLNNLENAPFGLSSAGATDYTGNPTEFANPYADITTGKTYANKFPYTFPTKGQAIDYSLYEPLGISTYGPNFRAPYAENFQLTVERELPSHIISRFSYVGSLAHRNQITYEGSPETQAGHDACLADKVNCGNPTNQAYRFYQSYYYPGHTQYGFVDPVTGSPAFTSIGTITSEGSSNYNSLQAEVIKGTSHGLQFTLSYTYSHALDDGSGYENSGYGGTTRGYNQFQHSLNYGNSTYDARQRLVFAPIYTTPLLRGHGTFSPINLALSGWQISGITTLATGFPFDISYAGGSSNSLWCSPGEQFYACPDEPNQVGSIVRQDPRATKLAGGSSKWFNAQASGLSVAPLGSFGNESRDRFHGPGLNNTNVILAKNFNLSADGVRRLQIRMESDNAFNHTQFSNPGSTVSSTGAGALSYGSAGNITAAAAARQTQLAAKFYF